MSNLLFLDIEQYIFNLECLSEYEKNVYKLYNELLSIDEYNEYEITRIRTFR